MTVATISAGCWFGGPPECVNVKPDELPKDDTEALKVVTDKLAALAPAILRMLREQPRVWRECNVEGALTA